MCCDDVGTFAMSAARKHLRMVGFSIAFLEISNTPQNLAKISSHSLNALPRHMGPYQAPEVMTAALKKCVTRSTVACLRARRDLRNACHGCLRRPVVVFMDVAQTLAKVSEVSVFATPVAARPRGPSKAPKEGSQASGLRLF